MRYTVAFFTALGALSQCSAAPTNGALVSREETTPWPKTLGPNDPPKMPDIDDAYQAIVDAGEEYAYLLKPEYSGWWSAIIDIAKLHPHGNWIKSLFGEVSEDGSSAEVILFKNGNEPHKYKVEAKNVAKPKDGKAIWPLLLELAAFSAGQEKDDAHTSDFTQGYLLPQHALEILTGKKAVESQPKNEQEFKDLLAEADINPTIVERFGPGYAAVERAFDDKYVYYIYDGTKKVTGDLKYEELPEHGWPRVWKLDGFEGFQKGPEGDIPEGKVFDRSEWLSVVATAVSSAGIPDPTTAETDSTAKASTTSKVSTSSSLPSTAAAPEETTSA